MTVRQLAKSLAFGVCAAVVSPLAALAWVEKIALRAEGVFVFFAQALAPVPGLPGSYLRAAYYFWTLDACSPEVRIGFGTVFTHRGARLSRNVSFGAYCVVGHATLGEGVRVASRVSIPSGKRQHVDESGRMIDGNVFERVTVGTGAWIGEGAIVLADVGPRCIVSAGAVVIHAVEADCIVGGNPARLLRGPAADQGG